jgi:hypothetical protein
VNELDVLRDEGIAFGEKMNAAKPGNAKVKVCVAMHSGETTRTITDRFLNK